MGAKFYPVLLLLFVAAPLAQGECLDAGRVKKIFGQYTIRSQTDQKGRAVEELKEFCDQENVAYKMFAALMLLEDLPALTVQRDRFDQDILGGSPVEFFRKRVGTIIFDRAESHGCSDGNTAAYVMSNEGRKIHICPSAASFDLIGMADTLVHEARHVDGFGHELCDHGDWAGIKFYGCDPNYKYKGSYAVGAEFNVRLTRTPNIPAETREIARANVVDAFLNNFNEAPVGLRKGMYLEQAGGLVEFYDGEARLPVFSLAGPQEVLAMRSGLPTVYSPATGEAHTYYSPTWIKTAGSGAKYFREKLSAAEQNLLSDVLYLKGAICMLLGPRLICSKNVDSDLVLTGIRPLGLVNWEGEYALLDESGDVFTLSVDDIGTERFREESFKRVANPMNLAALARWSRSEKLALNREGALLRLTKENPEGVPVFGEERFQRMLGPAWWSSELGDF